MADGGVQLKVCTKCGQAKPLDQFYIISFKMRPDCKKCYSEAHKRFRKNRSPEKRERDRMHQASYHARNAERIKIRQTEWANNNREKRRSYVRKWQEKNHDHQLWRGVVGRAKRKGLEVTIGQEWIRQKLLQGKCEVTGLPFSMEGQNKGRCGPFRPSIDRIDASKGYTPENCRVICWGLNMGLSEWGEETYALIARAYLDRS